MQSRSNVSKLGGEYIIWKFVNQIIFNQRFNNYHTTFLDAEHLFETTHRQHTDAQIDKKTWSSYIYQ